MGGAMAWPQVAAAQPASPTLGMLTSGTLEYMGPPFFRALRDMNFVEGRTLTVIKREAGGHLERLPALAQDLVNLKVDVIFTHGGPLPPQTVKAATAAIPIVFGYGGDPVADGLVPSLSRPVGNVTGATFLGAAFAAKRIELLKELASGAVDVALLLGSRATLAERQVRDATAATQTLGQRLHVFKADDGSEIDRAFADMERLKIAALLVGTDATYTLVHRDRIVALAARYRLPAIYDLRDWIVSGGLASYGTVLPDTWRQAGLYVGRILKGEKPADLPVVQPTKFETLINLRTARTLGLDVSPAMLARADEVIE
jgi:putative ABC transport system substrate-binding protein